MVEMRMRQKQIGIDRVVIFDEYVSKIANPCPRIEQEQTSTATNFQRRGIAAVSLRARVRSRNAATYAPKPDAELAHFASGTFAGHTALARLP